MDNLKNNANSKYSYCGCGFDENENLRNGLKDLALSRKDMDRKTYISELLKLFREENLDISENELEMILMLRQGVKKVDL